MKDPVHTSSCSSLHQAQKKPAPSKSRRPNVLVVDDEDYILVLLEEVLQVLGYRPLTASNAAAALDIIASNCVDLVITDMDMPGMSGMELLQKVKGVNPQLPIIFITGYGVDRAARAAQEYGADGFLGKPFHIEDLRRCISRLLKA